MTETELLLIHLRCKDVYLWLENERLRYRAPAGRLTARDTEQIRQQRDALIKLLGTASYAGSDYVAEMHSVQDRNMTDVQTHMLGYYPHLKRPEFLHPSSIWSWSGSFDSDVLQRSFEALTRRHSALRCRYVLDRAHEYRLHVDDDVRVTMEKSDLSSLPASERDTTSRRLVRTIVSEPFDLQRGPLSRLAVITLEKDVRVVAFVFHHTIMDSMSMGTALLELLALYLGIRGGTVPALADVKGGFVDLIREQNQWLTSEAAAAQAEYWRQTLQGTHRPLWLPHDDIHPDSVPSEDPGPVTSMAPREVIERIAAICRGGNMTLDMALMAAFAIAIARWRREPDVCTWVLTHGRHTNAHQGQVGCFMGSWALRARLDGSFTFRDALQLVAAAAFSAAPNVRMPSQMVAQIMEVIAPDLDRATIINYLGTGAFGSPAPATSTVRDHAAPFQVTVLNWLPAMGHLETVGGTQLLITIIESSENVRWDIQYDPTVFRRETITRLSNTVEEILQTAAGCPEINTDKDAFFPASVSPTAALAS